MERSVLYLTSSQLNLNLYRGPYVGFQNEEMAKRFLKHMYSVMEDREAILALRKI